MAFGSTLHNGDEDDNLLSDTPSFYQVWVTESASLNGFNQLSGNDTLLGAGGNDTLQGFEGDDSYEGGAGNDLLLDVEDSMDWGTEKFEDSDRWLGYAKRQRSGDDAMDGGDGNDTLSSFYGEDTLLGGNGDDILYAGADNDTAYGGEGNDIITDYEDPEQIVDPLLVGFANTPDGYVVTEGSPPVPHDFPYVLTSEPIVYTESGNDFFHGEGGNDHLSGLAGMDSLYGGSGDDTLDGGGQNDLLEGGDGADLLVDHHGQYGEDIDPPNSDSIFAYGGGQDTLIGGAGNDTLSAGIDDDVLDGGVDDDRLIGGGGNDTLNGGDGNDYLSDQDVNALPGGRFLLFANADAGDDQLFGGNGNDTLESGPGADLLDGGTGDDMLIDDDSSEGDEVEGNEHYAKTIISQDTLIGGDGNDTLQGGLGRDILRGDGGQNLYVYTALHESLENNPDFIIGFNQGMDRIGLDDLGFTGIQQGGASGSLLGYNQQYGDTFVYDEGSFKIRLDGTLNLTEADFSGFVGDGGGDTTPGGGEDTTPGGGDDTTPGGDEDNVMNGTSGNDTIFGSGDNDVINGLDGDDSIRAGGGDDTVNGGQGRDILHGGDGHNVFLYTDLNESVSSNPDFLIGFNTGDDKIDVSGLGYTGIQEGDASGSILGWQHKWGDTHITSEAGFAIRLDGTLILTEDNFIGFGDGSGGGEEPPIDEPDNPPAGDFDITGSEGNDTLFGTGAEEILGGLAGNDTIRAGDGNDTLVGGEGRDVLNGDGGNDIFRYDAISDSLGGSPDLIVGFEQGEDRLDLSALGFTGIQQGEGSGTILGWEQKWGDTHITDANGSFEVEIDGLFNVNDSDFLFA